jgi:hypothetical protein
LTTKDNLQKVQDLKEDALQLLDELKLKIVSTNTLLKDHDKAKDIAYYLLIFSNDLYIYTRKIDKIDNRIREIIKG